jgi:hypothetical protein
MWAILVLHGRLVHQVSLCDYFSAKVDIVERLEHAHVVICALIASTMASKLNLPVSRAAWLRSRLAQRTSEGRRSSICGARVTSAVYASCHLQLNKAVDTAQLLEPRNNERCKGGLGMLLQVLRLVDNVLTYAEEPRSLPQLLHS